MLCSYGISRSVITNYMYGVGLMVDRVRDTGAHVMINFVGNEMHTPVIRDARAHERGREVRIEQNRDKGSAQKTFNSQGRPEMNTIPITICLARTDSMGTHCA